MVPCWRERWVLVLVPELEIVGGKRAQLRKKGYLYALQPNEYVEPPANCSSGADSEGTWTESSWIKTRCKHVKRFCHSVVCFTLSHFL
jgi:hypothetical protein